MSESTQVETPGPGVYTDVPMGTYHRWDAASNSRLSRMMRSPAHLKAYMDEPDQGDTPARILGRAIHMAVLEPDRFEDTYSVTGRCVAMKNDGKRCHNSGTFLHKELGWVCGIHVRGHDDEELDDDLVILSASDYEICEGVRDAIQEHPVARPLVTGDGEVELSMLWQDKATGVLCKGRWDRHSPRIAGGAIVDVKTTRDASPAAFERAIFNYGYHRQAAFYLRGAKARKLPARHFSILAVEKEPPYAIAVYRITEGAVQAGEEVIDALLKRYADCERLGRWPGYPAEVRDISIPKWAWYRSDEQVDEIKRAEVA